MRVRYLSISVVLMLALAVSTSGQSGTDIETVGKIMDSAIAVEAPVYAPKTFDKAKREFDQAKQAQNLKRGQKVIDGYAGKAREFAENALKTTEVVKLSLKEYQSPRDKARAARAPSLVPALYDKAEQQFTQATAKVESGDVKGALKEADKASPLFDTAEFEAIRVDILGGADMAIAKAVADDAPKYALSTLDKARTAREKADGILVADRYAREKASIEAARAEFEGRHASNIAQSVRSLPRNDQAWEKLMLLYEIQMSRVGEALGIAQLPYDIGALAAADTLIAAAQRGQASSKSTEGKLSTQLDEITSAYDALTTSLQGTVRKLDGPESGDAAVLAKTIDSAVTAMVAERGRLAEQIAAEQGKMSELTEAHKEVSAELEARQKQEEILNQAKMMLNPTEGEVLLNATNDMVLRLSGLSFAVGKSEITEEHLPLLEKVKEIVALFPDRQIIVEGHTDDKGEQMGNQQLSEKRAMAVMQYLRQALTIGADRIKAIGYGSEKPIASNISAEGRAKNRRIDIVILQ
ncbi:MAG: OmpA family protein [Candidatus Zixiibacteriota bacterium]